jgi:steroid delta-isomerase-like uncharacterized protein
MATDKIALAKEEIEAFNAADWTRMKGLMTPDCVYEEPATQRRLEGPDAMVEGLKVWKEAFPDAKGTITKAFEAGDSVAQEITWTGTQTGSLVGPLGTVPATGKRVEVKASLLHTIRGDKVASSHHYFDLLGMLAQLGAIPMPARA